MWKFLKNIIAVWKSIRKQKTSLQQYLVPKLRVYQAAFSKHELYKIKHYYGLGSIILVGDAIAALHQKPLQLSTRKSLTLLASLTGIFDDFFDQETMSLDAIKNLMKRTNTKGLSDLKQIMAVDFYLRACEHAQNPHFIQEQAMEVFESQRLSLKQKDPNLSKADLLELSKQKGAASMLFYRACFPEELHTSEKLLLEKMGAIHQICNDIFDVYKDRTEGVNTFVHKCASVEEIRQILRQAIDALMQEASQTDFNPKAIQNFMYCSNIGLARTMVCLDFFQKNEKKLGPFQAQNWERKYLICDMELWKNRLVFLKKYYQLSTS